MKSQKAVRIAVNNIALEGLDDVLRDPIEVEALQNDTKLKTKLETVTLEKLNSYFNSNSLEKLELLPVSYVRVPKKEPFDFRKIAIIRPEDLAVYQAISVLVAEPFEKHRRPIARGRLFSYRFKPLVRKGQIFDPKLNYRSFQAAVSRKTSRPHVNYLVKCDIANFYDRVNIHRIHSTLLTTSGVEKIHADLINKVLLHWAKRDSYGLPIGSNGSRVLAEVALCNVDRSLKEDGIDFIRFVDDFRVFSGSAVEAHSALERLIELLDREGLFINTRKSSIKRINLHDDEEDRPQEEVVPEKINVREFRIFAGYGGAIPIRYRVPSKRSHKRYLQVDISKSFSDIRVTDFAKPEQVRDVLFAIIAQEKIDQLIDAYDLVGSFPQFYPFFVDMLIKNANSIPQQYKSRIVESVSRKLTSGGFLSEYMEASLFELVGNIEFFDRDSVMQIIRSLKRSAGTHLSRAAFDSAQNLSSRNDALEVRKYFDRSNEWERRRIITLMSKILPKEEYRAWLRAIHTYISKDIFAMAMK